MRIFTNANYDFIRWRWHAIVLSLVVILAGFGMMALRGGLPLGIDFSGGTHRHPEVPEAGHARRRPPARSTPCPAKKVVQQYGDPAQQPDADPAAADGGRRAGHQPRDRAPGRSSSALTKAEPRQVRGACSTELVGPVDRRRPAAQGHLRDARVDPRHHHLHRAPLPFQLRRRRHGGDAARHPGHARVPAASSATSCR